MSDVHLDRLLADLGERAAAEIAQVTAAGQADAERIRAAAAAEARTRMAEALARCDTEQSRMRANAIAATRRRARGALLEAQHAFVDRVLACSAEIIADRLRAAEAGAMRERVNELMSYADPDDAQVTEGADGIRLRADRGRLRIDDTVAPWLERSRQELAILICRAIDAPAATTGPVPC